MNKKVNPMNKIHLLGLSFIVHGRLERRTACSMFIDTNGHHNSTQWTEILEDVTCGLCLGNKHVKPYTLGGLPNASS